MICFCVSEAVLGAIHATTLVLATGGTTALVIEIKATARKVVAVPPHVRVCLFVFIRDK